MDKHWRIYDDITRSKTTHDPFMWTCEHAYGNTTWGVAQMNARCTLRCSRGSDYPAPKALFSAPFIVSFRHRSPFSACNESRRRAGAIRATLQRCDPTPTRRRPGTGAALATDSETPLGHQVTWLIPGGGSEGSAGSQRDRGRAMSGRDETTRPAAAARGRCWRPDRRIATPFTWRTKNKCLERINSINETSRSFDSCSSNSWDQAV